MIAIITAVFAFSGFAQAKPNYQATITKSYPGYKILQLSDFNQKFLTTKTPGLAVGDFNGDKLSDFAALIRSDKKKRYEAGKNSYDFYPGKFVICHGDKKNKYNCKALSDSSFTLPQESYLTSIKPQKTGCYTDKGKKIFRDVKTDAIGWYYPEKGGSHYIHQPNGEYQNCVTSD